MFNYPHLKSVETKVFFMMFMLIVWFNNFSDIFWVIFQTHFDEVFFFALVCVSVCTFMF